MFLVSKDNLWQLAVSCMVPYTDISRKVFRKNVHATILKGDMGSDLYAVPDTVAVELTFVAFL